MYFLNLPFLRTLHISTFRLFYDKFLALLLLSYFVPCRRSDGERLPQQSVPSFYLAGGQIGVRRRSRRRR